MFTTNEILVDSSILIEAIKGTRTALLKKLVDEHQGNCFIDVTVVSEFMFYFLAVNSTVAPLTLKMQRKIPKLLQHNKNFELLHAFKFLYSDDRLMTLVPEFMAKYNLLPNDSIILATCKIHGIKNLASYVSELQSPCNAEGIQFITE